MASERTIVISDLSVCQPARALRREPAKGCWRMVDYQTEDGISGTMLFAAPDDEAAEITLPLDVQGPHAIYVGINYTRAPFGDILHYTEWPLYGVLWLKLTGDAGFSRFATEFYWRQAEHFPSKTGKSAAIWHSIHQTYWQTADLTGRSLVIRPPRPPYNRLEYTNVANLSYIKLIPLSTEAEQWWRAQRPDDESRRLAVLWCTATLTGHTTGNAMYHPTDEQWIEDELAPFLDTDFGIVSWEAIRGNLCTFHTEIGDVGTEDNSWDPTWIDPLEQVTKVCHENKLKVFVSMRMIGASLPVVRNPIQWARNYWRHREWAKRDPEGLAGSNLSIAFAEVRKYWVDLMREALDKYGCDGAQLHLSRGFPFVLYEGPSAAAFKQRYGQDLREVADDDERFRQHQASYVTQFLRDFRAMLDERPNRSLAVTFIGAKYGSLEPVDPLDCGCDVEAWLREGLVDYLMPTPGAGEEAISRWKELGGGRVKVYPDLMPRTQPGENYAALAKKYYAAGADGLCIWDGERRCPRSSEWAVLRRLGHREMLDELAEAAPGYFQRVPLKMLNGMSVKYSFNDG